MIKEKTELLRSFCTPPIIDKNDINWSDIGGIEILDIPFRESFIKCYSFGTGKNVILVHGWGSKASHLIFIARYLSGNGFRVTLYDAPGHGQSMSPYGDNFCGLNEFGDAVKTVADTIQDVYAIVGHSIGGTISLFSSSGYGMFASNKLEVEKSILISPPSNVRRMLEYFCRKNNVMDQIHILKDELENEFNYKIDDYDLSKIIGNFNSNLMIVHDEDDEEMPIDDTLKLVHMNRTVNMVVTKNYGHKKILINGNMIISMCHFLKK